MFILDRYKVIPEEAGWKQSVFSLVKSTFWRYVTCWSAWGFFIYVFCGLFIIVAIQSLWESDWKNFLMGLFSAFCLYLFCWPFTILFHWMLKKTREQKTNSKKDNISLLLTIGLFLYPFVDAVITGGASQLFSTIGNDLNNLNSLTRPESIFTFLILFLLFFVAASIIFIVSQPLQAICTACIAIILFWLTNKIVSHTKRKIIHKTKLLIQKNKQAP